VSTATRVDKTTSMKPTRRPRTTGGPHLGSGLSAVAKRTAAAILEVLAGARTPTEAALALGLSVPRYYQIETRALTGLLSACEARPKGRQRNPANETAALRCENERLQREVTRHQSLARVAQRAVGLGPAPPTPAKTGKRTRKRRVARALSVAQRLHSEDAAVTAAPSPPPASGAP
jgi:hypothetical protein